MSAVVTSLARTLDQELLALARGASMECPCCGEFLMRLRGVLACPECRALLADGTAIPDCVLPPAVLPRAVSFGPATGGPVG